MQFLRTSALAVSVLALATASCATLFNGTTQRIHVASTPPGAEVFLDGEPVGATPTEISVSRRNREPQIRIQKEGSAHYVWPRRGTSLRILPSIAAGAYLGYASAIGLGCDECDSPNLVGLFIGLVPAVIDLVTGAAYEFPSRVDATLAPRGPEWSLRNPERRHRERDRWLLEPAGLRENLSRSLAPRRSAVSLEPPAQQAVRSMQPSGYVPLGDMQPPGDLGVRAVLDVPEPNHLSGCTTPCI